MIFSDAKMTSSLRIQCFHLSKKCVMQLSVTVTIMWIKFENNNISAYKPVQQIEKWKWM